MTYSSGQGGYGGPPQGPGPQGYGPQGYGPAPGPAQSKGLPFFLNLGVIALGILSFLLGFATYAKLGTNVIAGVALPDPNFFQSDTGVVSISLLLSAAVIAALGLLPKASTMECVVAGLSVTGFVSLLFLLINFPTGVSAGAGLILVMITGFLQSAFAIAVLLFSADIVKPPAPQQPQYGYYGPGGGYGQQPQQQPSPQQPYHSGGPGSGSYQQGPPSQPRQQHNQW
jgi:Family of unknown function (DUF5336)